MGAIKTKETTEEMKQPEIDIKDFLPLVRKPSRYIGGEVNSIKKDLSTVALTVGMGFPDVYEVGMSHLGIQILYQVLNARDEIACERVFAPWADMEALLRDKGAPLTTLESGLPLSELDVMGFSLQYELSYTNILAMLDLGGIPLLAADRADGDPLVIGGGPAAVNPEPVAEFFDAILIGDGEEAVVEMADAVIAAKDGGEGRAGALRRLARIEGVYVPSFFRVEYNTDNTVREVVPTGAGAGAVKRRILADINSADLPVRPVVPFTETVHDRLSVEISRGCTRGCRFCQAGMIYRPVRERTPATVVRIIEEGLANTGYDETSLLSLSTGDYTAIDDLLPALMRRFASENVAVSLPSLRVGTLSASLAEEIRRVRKTGFTLAPEAGTERMRQLVNKGIYEADLMAAAEDVFSLGWRSMKLYFMIGLPTETDEDIVGITVMGEAVKRVGKRAAGGRAPQINVSASTFIPKPFTPFQWEPQITIEESRRKQAILKRRLGGQKIGFKWHDPEMSLLEGVFARGDRRLSAVVRRAYDSGCRFDGWGECFSYPRWEAAFRDSGIEAEWYTSRRRERGEVFPWDHLESTVKKEFLWREYEQALELARTPDCKVDRCTDCGVCDHREVKNRPVSPGPIPGAEGVPPREAQSGTAAPEPFYGISLEFSKTGMMRFLSNFELVKAITRALRRAGLRTRYSGGFHPMPKLTLSPPLPVGVASVVERMEVDLMAEGGDGGELAAEEVAERLNRVLPPGLNFRAASMLSLKVATPSDMIETEDFLIFVKDGPEGLDIDPDGLEGLIEDFHSRDRVVVSITKKERTTEVDLKEVVTALAVEGDGALRLSVRTDNKPRVRPVDVVSSLFCLSRDEASLVPVLKTGPSAAESL